MPIDYNQAAGAIIGGLEKLADRPRQQRESALKERLLGAQVANAETANEAARLKMERDAAERDSYAATAEAAMGNKELKPFLKGYNPAVLASKDGQKIIAKAKDTAANRGVILKKAGDFLSRNAMNISGEDYAKVQEQMGILSSNKHAGPAQDAEKQLMELVGQEDAKKYTAAAASLARTGVTPDSIMNIQNKGGFNQKEMREIISMSKQAGTRNGAGSGKSQSFAQTMMAGISSGDPAITSKIKYISELDTDTDDGLKEFMTATGAKNSMEVIKMKNDINNGISVLSQIQKQQRVKNRAVKNKIGPRGEGLVDDKGDVQVATNVKLTTDENDIPNGLQVLGTQYVLDNNGVPVGIVVDGEQVPVGSEQHKSMYRDAKLGEANSGTLTIDTLQTRADSIKKDLSRRASYLKSIGLNDEAKRLRAARKSLGDMGISRSSLATLSESKRMKDYEKAMSSAAKLSDEGLEEMLDMESVGGVAKGIGKQFGGVASQVSSGVKKHIQNLMASVGAESELAVDDLIDASRKMDDVEALIKSTYIPKEGE